MQLPDGANNIVIGRLGTYKDPLALVGGNCAIKGFDHTGEDIFWTVSGWKSDRVKGERSSLHL